VDTIASDDSDRHIYFFYDGKGGSGKTSLTKYLYTKYDAWITDGGKHSDLAASYQGQRWAVFDIPRSFNGGEIPDDVYGFAEKLKDGFVFSGKYESRTKTFTSPKVIFFANTLPNRSKWTHDRLILVDISHGGLCEEGQAQPFQAGSQAN
jgi:hypothetical protein